MRFEVLRQRVERAETRVESCMDRAYSHRQVFREAWRRGWTPGRIVVAGLLSGFLVGRAEPLSKVGGARWLQMLGTVSTMLASLRAAAASEVAIPGDRDQGGDREYGRRDEDVPVMQLQYQTA